MIDIVYTLKPDPRAGNRQLIYSLRSVEKYLKNVRNVFVIGADPRLKNVIHIPHPDTKGAPNNIYSKLVFFSELTEILRPGIRMDMTSLGDFLYMADDYFILSEANADTYPHYTNGFLSELMNNQRNGYRSFIRESEIALRKNGKSTANFNVHAPFRYNRQNLIELAKHYPPTHIPGYLVKSIYGNHFGIQDAKELKDCKIRSLASLNEFDRRTEGRNVFSTGMEDTVPEIMAKLESLYPEKSKYE